MEATKTLEEKNETRMRRAKASRKRNKSIAGRDDGVNQCKNRIRWLAKRVILSDPALTQAFSEESAKGDDGKSIKLTVRFENGGEGKNLVVDAVNYYLNHLQRNLLVGISTNMATMAKGQKKENGKRMRSRTRVTAQHVLSVACNFFPKSLAQDMKTIYEEIVKEVRTRHVDDSRVDLEDAEGDSRPKYRKFSLSTAPVEHAFRLMCNAYTMGEFVPIAMIAANEAMLRRLMLLALRFMTGNWEIEAFSKNNKFRGHANITLSVDHLYIAANYDHPPYTEKRGLAAIIRSREYGVRYVPVEHCTAIGASKYRPEMSWKEDIEAYRKSKKARENGGAKEVAAN